MKATVVIPARLAARRLPGKPLLDIAGLPMVERVRRQAARASRVERVIVATPDEDVARLVASYGGEVVVTGPARCGTDRVFETVADALPDLVVNVQGDMPLLRPEHVDVLIGLLVEGAEVATLATSLRPMERRAPEIVKVYRDGRGRALSFSRSPRTDRDDALRHVGIYGFTGAALSRCATLPVAPDEMGASLEQLRWMEAGVAIDVSVVDDVGPAVDTAEQLATVRRLLERRSEAT